MKRTVGWIVRMGLTAVGLALIAVLIAINWRGQVVLPADYFGQGQPERRIGIEAVQGQAPNRTFIVDDKGLGAFHETEFSSADNTPTRIPGLPEMLNDADKPLLMLGLLIAGLAFPIQAARWLLLMRCRGMEAGFGKAFRLTLVGQFFSVFLPGATGGDLVKAYYVARGSGARARAIMSVLADRVCGLIGLVVLVGIVGLVGIGEARVGSAAGIAWAGLIVLVVAGALYTSRTLRGLLRLGALVERVPGGEAIKAIDAAAVAYRAHLPAVGSAVGLSVAAHLCLASAVVAAGHALGMTEPWHVLLTLVPIALLMGAIPIMPSGLGVMEGAAVLLIDAPMGLVIGMMLMHRFYLLVYSLIGGALTLRGDIHLHPPLQAEQADGGASASGAGQADEVGAAAGA